MNLDMVTIEKCRCGHAVCNTHGLNIGTFYQGSGWDKETALEIAHRLNSYDILVNRLKKISESTNVYRAKTAAKITLEIIEAARNVMEKGVVT